MTATASLLHDLLDAAADRTPDGLALRHGPRGTTYATVREQSQRIAGWLAASGIRGGDRVLIVLDIDVLLPPMLFACSRVGAVFVVLHKDVPAAVAAQVLNDAAPTLVLTDRVEIADVARRHGVAVHGIAGRAASRPPKSVSDVMMTRRSRAANSNTSTSSTSCRATVPTWTTSCPTTCSPGQTRCETF